MCVCMYIYIPLLAMKRITTVKKTQAFPSLCRNNTLIRTSRLMGKGHDLALLFQIRVEFISGPGKCQHKPGMKKVARIIMSQ